MRTLFGASGAEWRSAHRKGSSRSHGLFPTAQAPAPTGLVLWGLKNLNYQPCRKRKDIAMGIFYGPIEYLRAFALVLATGIFFGFGLGWHFCQYFRWRASHAYR
jgi:hypothetical protein